MAGVNKAIIIGRLGQDPEIRYLQSGNAVVNFSMATSEKWTDKNTGQQQEKTEWHRCVCFGKPAETINQYCTKGSQLYVEGQLQTRQWEKDGQTHYTTEILVRNFQFLSGNRQQGQGGNQGGYQSQGHQGGQGQRQGGYQHNPNEYTQRPQQRDQYRQQGGGSPQGQTGGPDPIPDDDIPF